MSSEVPLRYGGDRAFGYFESLDPQGKPGGFLVDLSNAIAAHLERLVRISLQE